MILAFRIIMILFVVVYGVYLVRDCIKNGPKNEPIGHKIAYAIMGFVLNILDTLGVGSNATQAAFFKLTKLSPDDELPGNGNVIFAIPVAVEFLLFLDIVEVEPVTLITMIVASVLGAVVGARVVSRLPINAIRKVLAVTLPVVAYFIVKSMPVKALTYIVAAVLVYMSISFIITLSKEGKKVQ